ncbi:MAG TPA: hypothetical protein VGP13_02205, partial [Candidatus Paceibacterota bacterium]|nr:hypothetical protein [Candidatus Paceibacterota bacterium]
LCLLASGDLWRKQISGWREHKKESLQLSYKSLIAAVDAYLETGHDVIVERAILNDDATIDSFVGSGKKHGAEVHEFILTADKEVIIKRAHERGFHENGLLTPQRVEDLWHATEELRARRPHATVIDTGQLDSNAVYEKVKKYIGL